MLIHELNPQHCYISLRHFHADNYFPWFAAIGLWSLFLLFKKKEIIRQLIISMTYEYLYRSLYINTHQHTHHLFIHLSFLFTWVHS